MPKKASPTRQYKREQKGRHERLRNKRKVKAVAVNPEMMGYMLIHGTGEGVTAEGLPKDVVSIGWQYSPERMCLLYFYGHEDFPPIPEGEVIPQLEVVLTKNEEKPSE